MVAARDVLADDPRADLSVIAARAGIQRTTTLYRHFPTREDLIAGLYEAYLDDAEVVIRGTNPQADDLFAEIENLTGRLYEVNLTWRAFAWAPAYSIEAQTRPRDDAGNTPCSRRPRRGVCAGTATLRQILATWGAPILFLASAHQRGELDPRRGRRLHDASAGACRRDVGGAGPEASPQSPGRPPRLLQIGEEPRLGEQAFFGTTENEVVDLGVVAVLGP